MQKANRDYAQLSGQATELENEKKEINELLSDAKKAFDSSSNSYYIKKIIKLLAKDIYDSPYALLRENLQNAYDAILMRKVLDPNPFVPCIRMNVSGDKVIISDNGVGMTLEVVENNYWKAGSSGKNNEEARKAGVVGTFGIGAMANFGVCEKLEVVCLGDLERG